MDRSRRVLRCAVLTLALAATGAGAGELTVDKFGVGGGIENRELVDERDRFQEGERVVFWTRVVGGEAGDRIRHVWTRDGVVALDMGLSVGGPRWRTHSIKTMWPGLAGNWTVVATDSDGRELARVTFVCEPAAAVP